MKLIIAEDERLILSSIAGMFQQEHEVYTAADGEELLRLYHLHGADLIITDLSMPRVTGQEAIRLIRKNNTRVIIIVLTIHEDGVRIREVNRLANCVMLKRRETLESFAAKVNDVIAGNEDPRRYLVDIIYSNEVSTLLTTRENEIVKYVNDGYGQNEIARMLGITIKTFKTHIRNIIAKNFVKRYILMPGRVMQ